MNPSHWENTYEAFPLGKPLKDDRGYELDSCRSQLLLEQRTGRIQRKEVSSIFYSAENCKISSINRTKPKTGWTTKTLVKTGFCVSFLITVLGFTKKRKKGGGGK